MPIDIISNILQKNRSANVSNSAFFYLLDTANIDYRVKAIQDNSAFDPTPMLEENAKFIIRNSSSLHPAFGPSIAGLQNNDIVIYKAAVFSLYVDVSNPKTNQGSIVYNDQDDKLYYYNGVGWRSLGIGSLIGTPNQISVIGSTGDVQVGLTPIVIINNYIQTPMLMFENGVTMGGITNTQQIQISGNLNIKGSLLVDGEVITKTAFRGYTSNAGIENVTDVSLDAGDY